MVIVRRSLVTRGKRFAHAAGAVYLLVVVPLFHHAALLAPSASSTRGLGAQSVNGLVPMLLDLGDRGCPVAGAVLALCLLPLGSLAYRSSRLPRVIGVLLVVSLGVSTLTAYALPGLPALVQQALAPPPIADLWLVLYLVAAAGRLPKLHQQQDERSQRTARRRS